MNPETPKPSREEIEVRLTALLLGELPAEEAALLRWAIEQDAELAKLHERLKRAIELTREVAANPAETATTHTAPLKLSDERREKLLAHFKTVKPKEFAPKKRPEISRLVALAAVLVIIALLAAMLLPALSKAKSKAMRTQSMALMKQRAIERSLTASAEPPSNDRVESGKAAPAQHGDTVYSQSAVGYINIPADNLPPKESVERRKTIPAKPPVEKHRYANNIVLPPAATEADEFGTFKSKDTVPSSFTFSAGNGGDEVGAHEQLVASFQNSPLMQRQQNNATVQANSSSTLDTSGFGGRGGGGGRRGAGGGGNPFAAGLSGGGGDKRENALVEVADSGTVSPTPADDSKVVSRFAYALVPEPSQVPFRSGKQDGINLNVVELNVQKPVDETPWASGYKTQSALVGYDDPGAFTPKAQSSIVIKYALASDIASALNSAGGAISSPVPNSGTTFAVDPQTHEIIFNADAETTKQIKEVIAKLDSPLQQGLIESVVMDVANGDTFTVQNGIVGQDKVPLLGDLPAAGRLWRSESKAVAASDALFSETPAASTAPVSGNSLFLGRVAQLKSQAAGTSSAGEKILVPGAVAANWNTDGDATLSKGLTRVGSGNLKSGDS
ncbi:MAG TPA: secretin N-terminal domain-containing protein, partial [Verrucomicrobiae bacterium]